MSTIETPLAESAVKHHPRLIPKPANPPLALAPPPVLPTAGLCTSCELTPDCSLWRRHDEPVWHCEEFEDGAIQGQAKSGQTPAGGTATSPQQAGTNRPVTTPGLCLNCELATGCHLPRPSSGVWHCEEYR